MNDFDAFDVASHVLMLLSALGCIFNLIATFLLKHHRNVLGKMMIFLSISDLICIIAILDGWKYSLFLMVFPTYIMWVSWTGSVLWVCCFAHALLTSVKFGEECLTNALFQKYAYISIIVSILIASPIAIFDSSFCYTPLAVIGIASIIYCTTCYITVFQILRQGQGKAHLELLLYPLILMICELAMVMIHVYMIFHLNKDVPQHFYQIGELLFVSRGVWNSLAYGLSSKIRSGFKTLCRRRDSLKDQKLLEYTNMNDSQSMNLSGLRPPNFVLKYNSILSRESLNNR